MNIRPTARWAAALVLVSLAVPQWAAAQDDSNQGSAVHQPGGILDASPKQRPQMLSFFLTVPYHFGGLGIGLGARYQIPLVHDGFIPKLNDSFELEFGADFYYAGGYCVYSFGCGGGVGLTIPVEAMWTFHIFPKFSAYGKLGLGVNLFFGGSPYVVQGNVGPLWFQTAAGIIFHVTESIYLRAEIGYPTLKFGIGIPL